MGHGRVGAMDGKGASLYWRMEGACENFHRTEVKRQIRRGKDGVAGCRK